MLYCRNQEIDILRGIAIIAILILHAGVLTKGLDDYPWLMHFVLRFSTGVQLFFVLSGYLVAQSMDRCVAKGEGVRGFLIRRFAKLTPPYLLFMHVHIGLFLVTSWLAPDVPPLRNSVTTEALTISNYLLHLVFLQGFVPAQLHTLLDGSWSIVIEVYFYLFFAFIPYKFIKTSLSVFKTYIISIGLAIVCIVLIGRHHSGYSHYAFFAQFPCFLLGVSVQRIKNNPGFKRQFSQWDTSLVAVALLLALGFVKGETKPLGDSHIYAILFAILLFSSGSIPLYFPKVISKIIANFGKQSYAIFFIHMVLLNAWYVLASAYEIEIIFWFALALNIFIAVPLTWVISYFFIDPIDRFFVTRADKFLARRN